MFRNRGYMEVAERVAWTLVQAGAAYLAVEAANWDYEWVPVLATVLALVKNVAARELTGSPSVPESADGK